jgi:hypothetical protein
MGVSPPRQAYGIATFARMRNVGGWFGWAAYVVITGKAIAFWAVWARTRLP